MPVILRHARTTDEGGRGLFLLVRMTEGRGTRCTREGKTVWTEQPLTGTPVRPSRAAAREAA